MRTLTLAAEDSRYGVPLQAEPDNMKLGKRLKGDFKAVAPAIKKLTNEQLEEFQEKGEIVVLGHTLSREDLKVSREIEGYFCVVITHAQRERGKVISVVAVFSPGCLK